MRIPAGLCLLVAVLLLLCAFTDASYPPKPTAWDEDGNSIITVNGPDDPSYPYQTTGWWDRWVWENREECFNDTIKASFDTSKLDGLTFLRVNVDTNGYVVPLLERFQQLQRSGNLQTVGDYLAHKPAPYTGPPYHFWMLMDSDLFNAFQKEAAKRRYQSYPKVPKWLVNSPTMQRAIALPDGRWVVVVYQDESPDACSVIRYGKYENYLLYSANGELLEPPHQRKSSLWYDMMWDYIGITSDGPYAQFKTEDNVAGAKLPGLLSNAYGVPGGYTAMVDFATDDLLALYDYDGTPLFERNKVGDKKTALAVRTSDRFMYCVDLEHQIWQQVYDAQNK